IIDASDATAKGLNGWQWLQRQGGRATILGNVNSMIMQPLNQVITLSDAGPTNYLRGVASNVSRNSAIKKSAFITARETEANKPIRGGFERAMDVGGVPLREIELASVKQTWHTMHAKAKAMGLKGDRAIQQADFDT